MNIFKVLFGGGKSEASESAQAPQETGKKDFEILKFDGVKALKVSRFDYAVSCFNYALDIKEDLEVRDYLSRAYLALDDLPNAYQQLEKLSQAQPDNIAIHLRMAQVSYMMENYVTMSSACEKALLIDKDNVEALVLYAKASIGTDDATNAIAMLTKAINLKEDYAEAYLLRGQTLLKEGNTDDAAADAEFLLKNYAGNEEILMLKADLENHLGNTSEAILYYTKVIDANPFSAQAYRLRGELKQKSGDEAGAKEDLSYADELSLSAASKQEDIESKVKEAYNNVNPMGL